MNWWSVVISFDGEGIRRSTERHAFYDTKDGAARKGRATLGRWWEDSKGKVESVTKMKKAPPGATTHHEDLQVVYGAALRVLDQANARGVKTVSAEDSYRAVSRKTNLVDDVVGPHGDKYAQELYTRMLREAAVQQDVEIVA